MLMQILQGLCGIHPPIHADECASARGNQVDGVDFTVFAEEVRKVFFGNQFGQVANPQGGAAHCKKYQNLTLGKSDEI